MLKQIIVILFVFHTSFTYAQSLPLISQKQMYDDFDTLTKMIIEVSPQGPVREKVTGLNLPAELKKLRTQISAIKSTAEFGALVRTAITLCQDGHTSLIRNKYFDSEKDYLDRGISPDAISLIPTYDSLLTIAANKPFNLRLKYLQGSYYTIGSFSYQGKEFPSGLKLIKCNDIDIHKYVNRLLGVVRMMRWDFKEKRYFAENFFNGYHLSKKDGLLLTFKDSNGREITSKFLLNDTLTYTSTQAFTAGISTPIDTFKTVEYFSKEQVLYIRVPRMALEYLNYYPLKIQQEGSRGPLKKVIIDIRNNPGGADNVWVSILENIIAAPIAYQNVLLCNNSPTMRNLFPKAAPNWKPYPISFLNQNIYGTYHIGSAVIKPDSNSIKYEGKIYILQNENIYSSAGSFTAVAQLAENLITVGTPTGRLLGRGINPLLFELPNSKLLYRIEPVIDFLNVQNAEDVFHDKVEIPIELTLEEYLDRISSKDSLYAPDYLFKKDTFFRKVIMQH
jgi:hypothetical protein